MAGDRAEELVMLDTHLCKGPGSVTEILRVEIVNLQVALQALELKSLSCQIPISAKARAAVYRVCELKLSISEVAWQAIELERWSCWMPIFAGAHATG